MYTHISKCKNDKIKEERKKEVDWNKNDGQSEEESVVSWEQTKRAKMRGSEPHASVNLCDYFSFGGTPLRDPLTSFRVPKGWSSASLPIVTTELWHTRWVS
jgi:hypothetical protein